MDSRSRTLAGLRHVLIYARSFDGDIFGVTVGRRSHMGGYDDWFDALAPEFVYQGFEKIPAPTHWMPLPEGPQ